VLLQTHYPDHPTLQSILTKSYADHARSILVDRLALGMPPASSIALIRTDAKDANTGELFLEKLRSQSTDHLPVGASLVGPLPAPMQRRAGLFRSQLLLMANSRKSAQLAASILVNTADKLPARGLKWTIDIDPQYGL
jgi:primosomal protein N' (replication factor Y)